MQTNLHLVFLVSVVYTFGVSGKSAKSTLSVSLAIVIGLFSVSLTGTVYTFDKVPRFILSVSLVVVLNSPSVIGGSIYKYIWVNFNQSTCLPIFTVDVPFTTIWECSFLSKIKLLNSTWVLLWTTLESHLLKIFLSRDREGVLIRLYPIYV